MIAVLLPSKPSATLTSIDDSFGFAHIAAEDTIMFFNAIFQIFISFKISKNVQKGVFSHTCSTTLPNHGNEVVFMFPFAPQPPSPRGEHAPSFVASVSKLGSVWPIELK